MTLTIRDISEDFKVMAGVEMDNIIDRKVKNVFLDFKGKDSGDEFFMNLTVDNFYELMITLKSFEKKLTTRLEREK